MMELHPKVLKKNGKKEFVVLPYEEYAALEEMLSDYEDLLDLRAAKREESDQPSLSIAETKRELGL